ncbi:MAG: Acetate CoA-transferase YdiF [Syntrophorhabdaceae bacterium PtaU1.Bin034]|nr:MAG: Acetate CoA-transferase YdiF [Syntrophorhabdaceae bacterium PtaU1.Bin034]
MNKVITAAEAAALIKDGDTVAASCFGLAGWAEEVGLAVQEHYKKTGHPKGITIIHAAGAGDFVGRGECALAEDGLMKRMIVSHVGSSPRIAQMVKESRVECHLWPLGVICQWFTEVARRSPGLFSKTGLGTFIDPRFEGGKVNEITKEETIRVVELEGEEWLFFKSLPINVSLIRGTTADEKGNITFEKEAIALEALPVAQAAKACGGIVIAQVENLAKAGTLHPQRVRVPGVCVDYIVIARKPQMQTMSTVYNPALSGDLKIPETSIPFMELDERKIIARRAAMELVQGPVNLGMGIPQGIANIVAEEGCSGVMTLISESGNIGGIPGVGTDFGAHYNGEAMIQQDHHFNWFDGGGLAMAAIGLAQTDREGNINAGKFGDRVVGPGGLINTAQHAKKVVFCGAFTAGRLEVKTGDGKLTIVNEGKSKKFLNKVEQITFSGNYSWKAGQRAVYVTERAVFERGEDGLVLTEIAPGVDLEKDVLRHMDFEPRISPDLKLMPEGIFKPAWGDLKNLIGA